MIAGAAVWFSNGENHAAAPSIAAQSPFATSEPGDGSRPYPTSQARALLPLLREADTHGLDPLRYHLIQIEQELARSSIWRTRTTSTTLTNAIEAYAHDLRVPRNLGNVTYIDRELAPKPITAADLFAKGRPAAELRGLQRLNPTYQGLRVGLRWYRNRWSNLPQVRIPPGHALGPGSRDERVSLLRRRLGLQSNGADSDRFDEELGQAVGEFRRVHGIGSGSIADRETIDALNAGAAHYEQLIIANMDRARGLPVDNRPYVLVDSAGAQLWMIENGKVVDRMRVIVGKVGMDTPELAGFIRFAVLNPYWNVPPDLVRQSIAPAVLREGPSYLARRRLVLFTDWKPGSRRLQPEEVDWAAVATGRQHVWVRQLPGGDNMMGDIKFMLPNRLGIYLHDTPRRKDFERHDRHLSSGCVRVEDARRLARWIFKGRDIMKGRAEPESRVNLPEPIPVYISYFTAAPEGGEIRFRQDVYDRDQPLLARLKQAPRSDKPRSN